MENNESKNGSNGADNQEPDIETRDADQEAAVQKEVLYLRAEFENYKKRILKEQDQAIRFGNEKLIREILSVADLFDRAMAHARTLRTKNADPEIQNLVNGIEMTQRELIQALSRFGVEFIGTVGEKFDPGRHEAISQQEAGPEEKDSVLQVLQKGSLLHGRLVAPAKVVVAKPSDA